MRFANSELFFLLLLIPFLGLFFYWSARRKTKLLDKFVSAELRERLLIGISPRKVQLKRIVLITAVLFLVLTLVRLQWGFSWEETKRQGVDIIVALDLSQSMLAEDLSPNRLERAKREIIDLLQIVEGDRIGIVAFAGTSFLQVPLTLDYGAVQLFLDDLKTDLIPVPGTAIADAIERSITAYDQKNKMARVLILITDGEDHEGDPVAAAKKAKSESVRIYTVGIGQEGGAPIPDPASGGFKKDRNGEMVLSKLDETTLQKIALETNGSYVRSVSGDLDLEKIYQDIQKNVHDKDLKSGKRKLYEERYQWPLLIAILLLVLEALISERKRLSKILILALIIPSAPAQAFFWQDQMDKGIANYESKKYDQALKNFLDAQIDHPNDEKVKYNTAQSYYRMQRYADAEKIYMELTQSKDLALAQQSFYNLGNSFFQQGKLQEAIAAFEQAVKLNPQDQDAQHNLEFVRKELKKRLDQNKKEQQERKSNPNCPNPNQQQQQQQDGQKQGQQQDPKRPQQQDQQKQQQSQQQPSAGQPKQDATQDTQNQKAQAARKGEEKKMSKEEAERWLSTLDENRKKYLEKQMLEQSQHRYEVEKDW